MGEREEDMYSTASTGKPPYEEQDTRDQFIGGGGDDESLYNAVSGLLRPIFFPGDKNSASIFRRTKDSFLENLPNLRDACKNSGVKLVKWARNGSPLRLLLVVSMTLLTLTGILVFLLFLAAATTNAVILSLFVSLAAAGGCLAIFFACLAAIYIGVLSVALFVISSVIISTIIASLIVTASIEKMSNVFSYIWKWSRPTQEGESRKTQQEDDQLSQQKESYYITVPDVETRDVSSSNPINVNDIPQAQSIVVDLSKVQPEVAKKKGKQQVEVCDKKVVLTNTEIINKVCNNVSKDTSIKMIGQYTSKQKILLVGEGDFSFSACLAVAFGSASNIIATSLNSQEFLTENYGKFLNNKMELENRGGAIIHGVNAMTMAEECEDLVLGILKFDRIIFNFPHCGKFGRTDADTRANKELIMGFLRNAKKMIKEDGEIHVTHKSNGYFLEWDIPKIGSDQGLRLIQEIKFKHTKYPGYNTKFGFGGDENFDCTPCKTYKFGMYSK